MCSAFARNSDPLSSHQAAESISCATTERERIVLEALTKLGPMTTHKIADMTGLTVVTVSPRIKPLRLLNLVEATGLREMGRSIWRAIPQSLQDTEPAAPQFIEKPMPGPKKHPKKIKSAEAFAI